jgi:hypothetical protein
MVDVVCIEVGVGPECVDPRREDAKPLFEDCIENLFMREMAKIWECRATILERKPFGPIEESNTSFRPGTYTYNITVNNKARPLDDLACMQSVTNGIMDCYCGGFSGLRCTTCNPQFGVGSGGAILPDPEEADDAVRDPPSLSSVTVSSTDLPIPLVYGTAFLAGNIIWTSPVRYNSRNRAVLGLGRSFVPRVRVCSANCAIGWSSLF